IAPERHMAAIVGGRIEAVPPRRSLFGPDYLRLAALLAVSLAVHAWLVAPTAGARPPRTPVPPPPPGDPAPHAPLPPPRPPPPPASAVPWDDARSALDVIKSQEHPPGYPVAIWVTAKFVRRLTPLPLPDSTLLAAQLVSAIAGILLIVPTYLLGRMLFGRNVGF